MCDTQIKEQFSAVICRFLSPHSVQYSQGRCVFVAISLCVSSRQHCSIRSTCIHMHGITHTHTSPHSHLHVVSLDSAPSQCQHAYTTHYTHTVYFCCALSVIPSKLGSCKFLLRVVALPSMQQLLYTQNVTYLAALICHENNFHNLWANAQAWA